jgi:hypothetical protein
MYHCLLLLLLLSSVAILLVAISQTTIELAT